MKVDVTVSCQWLNQKGMCRKKGYENYGKRCYFLRGFVCEEAYCPGAQPMTIRPIKEKRSTLQFVDRRENDV